MLAVCAAGRILNPKAARSQVIGAMTMGVGAALMEDLVVDKRHGLLREPRSRGLRGARACGYPASGGRVFLDEADPILLADEGKRRRRTRHLWSRPPWSPMPIYNATGVRVRDYPITLEKLLEGLPEIA
jgi:xanthine dehydrogenase YagR molybdenum-binding subunit